MRECFVVLSELASLRAKQNETTKRKTEAEKVIHEIPTENNG